MVNLTNWEYYVDIEIFLGQIPGKNWSTQSNKFVLITSHQF